jgi:copper chaperone NosL
MGPAAFRRAALAALLLLPACGEEQTAEVPLPRKITREAVGYYCNMIVQDHPGPKGQIFLSDQPDPIWFSSVRDTIAFTLLPEEAKNIAAIYVNDMSRAAWEAPEAGTWIEAESAWFVIGSERRGGMGAPEAVPFSAQSAAEAFAARHGGEVVAFADVSADAILGAITELEPTGHEGPGDAMSHGHSGTTDDRHEAGMADDHDRNANQEAHR